MSSRPRATGYLGRPYTPQLDLSRFVKGQGHAESYWDGTEHLNINLSGIPAQVALDMLKVLAGSEAVPPRAASATGLLITLPWPQSAACALTTPGTSAASRAAGPRSTTS